MSIRSGSNAALVVVDVQVDVVANAWERDRIVANVALAVRRARDAGVVVVWVQHDDAELKYDTPGWAWVPELSPLPTESLVRKHFNSAFEGTELDSLLDGLGVAHVFLAGAATNWCIRATAYAALERGFDVTLLSDAHTTEDMVLSSGRVIEAQSVVDDLNIALRWLAYPGRANAAVPTAEVEFGSRTEG